MEYCEEGSLRAALDAGRLRDARTGRPDLQVTLPLSLDVARALHHMHQEQLLHGDLKASNVLLAQGTVHGLLGTPGDSQSGSSGSSGTVASAASEVAQSGSILALVKERPFRLVGKVSDFGLSLAMDSDITHVSHMHAGTLTHMAPELLLEGRASRASDVYAYGILLWEMLTGQRAFNGTPIALLAHSVARKGARPSWPEDARLCKPLVALVEKCWAADVSSRPCFNVIILVLEDLLQQAEESLLAWEGPLALPSGCTCTQCTKSTSGV